MREVYHLIKERKMAVALDNEELAGLRNRLKSGEYDGKDIMQAWLAVDELRELRAEVQDAWYAGLDAGREQGRGKDHAHQPAAMDEAAAIHAFEEHFQANSDDPYFEGELKLWLTAWGHAYAALAQQPAAVADATVARLTKDQRTRLVEKLVADQVEGADRMSSYLWEVLENGFRGYNNYTDQELLDAHWGAFGEDFFGLESGDDQ